jgi:N-acetylmuramoyl-L-alanine amidase
VKPRVLNAWSTVTGDPADSSLTAVSMVSLESTAIPDSIDVEVPVKKACGDYLLRVKLAGVGLTMAEDDIIAADGLIRRFAVREGPSPETVYVDIHSEFETGARVSITEGMPHRIDIAVSRKPLLDLMAGRRIAVDPGHGGKDAGIRGPVNLLEKDCALAVALELAAILRSCGAVPLLTRDDDSYLEPGMRLAKMTAASPELAVEIHMAGEKDPLARSYHIRAIGGCENSRDLASSISEALRERMGLSFGPIEELQAERALSIPLVRVEPVCLTYFADEANFRAPLFRKRLAQGIMNGISRYIRSRESKGGTGSVT